MSKDETKETIQKALNLLLLYEIFAEEEMSKSAKEAKAAIEKFYSKLDSYAPEHY